MRLLSIPELRLERRLRSFVLFLRTEKHKGVAGNISLSREALLHLCWFPLLIMCPNVQILEWRALRCTSFLLALVLDEPLVLTGNERETEGAFVMHAYLVRPEGATLS